VIVGDDGSSDETAEVVRSFGQRLRMCYHFQEDLGFRAGAARNAGARLASAPVLAFLDTGSLASADFVRAHCEAHRRHVAVMRGQHSHDVAYYRCRYPTDYALANRLDHPKT
jgi:glycosyltransferase involved in cell wall biosynthesis